MKKLIVILLMAPLLMGCNEIKEIEAVTVPSTPSTQTTTSPIQIDTSIQSTYSDIEKNNVEKKLSEGDFVAISPGMKYMEVGETYIFALGIKNREPNTETFKLMPELYSAKTSGGLSNLIHTDDTILNWISDNDFKPFELDTGEQKIMPFKITVGPNVIEEGKTVPGSYTFDIVFEIETTPRFWDRYNIGIDPLVIKVK